MHPPMNKILIFRLGGICLESPLIKVLFWQSSDIRLVAMDRPCKIERAGLVWPPLRSSMQGESFEQKGNLEDRVFIEKNM